MTRRRVIVCGAGMAGLAAAVSAAEAGAEVRVFEKSPAIGGTTFMSQGRIWTLDTLEQFAELSPNGNAKLHRLLHGQMATDMDWLERCGVVIQNEEHGIFGHGWGRNMNPEQGLNRLVEVLTAAPWLAAPRHRTGQDPDRTWPGDWGRRRRR
jgi:succinate dehydrogenase/fumarate reductase flavoprotein subunit